MCVTRLFENHENERPPCINIYIYIYIYFFYAMLHPNIDFIYRSTFKIIITFSRVCTVIDHTRWSRVAWLLFFTRCDVFCDLLQYTHTEKCNLSVLYNKNSNCLLKDFRGHEKRKTSLLTWSDVDFTPSVCVCPLIDHDQQPMKMHTEVTLLHKEE